MFSDRLNTAMQTICANSSDIARLMECDRSNVSRFLKGQRTPRRGGGASQRLAGAVYAAAEKNKRTVELCGLISCEYSSAEDTRSRLIDWLYQDSDDSGEPSESAVRSEPHRSFGQRLDAVMCLTQTSNARLGKLISIDPSYISRFRNGFRSPKSNLKIMNGMASFLLDRVYDRGLLRELGELIAVKGELSYQKNETYPLFYQWLYGVKKDDSPVIEHLMEQIETFPKRSGTPTKAEIINITPERSVYQGRDGLREAVLMFLDHIIKTKRSELYLYSDQNMDWMITDRSFLAKWSSLMISCIKNGTEVTIIHNIERGLYEMTRAIQSWLPLYPSGGIRSFYCKRRSDTRFSTTLFLCPGYAAISGHNIKNSENEYGIFRFDTDPEILDTHMRTFNALLRESGELVKAFDTEQIDKIATNANSGMTVLSSRLSLATMPESVFSSLIGRTQASDAQKRRTTEMWERQREFYKRCLSKYYINECIPIGTDKTPMADLPGFSVRYTAEEYREHLREILRLSQTCRGYRLFALPEPTFENIRIRIMRDEIIVSRLNTPRVTYVFEHPYMCGSFIAYGRKIVSTFSSDKQKTNAELIGLINEP